MDIPGLNGPYAHSVQSLEEALLQSILGNTPLAPFVPSIATIGNRMLGMQNDVLLQSILFTNMTPYGVYNAQREQAVGRMAGNALRIQRDNAQLAWLKDIGKATMSYESWLKQQKVAIDTPEHRREYENWAANQAYGRSGDFFWNTAYSLLDPDGIAGASEYLGEAASNVARHNLRRTNRLEWRQTKAVGKMFDNYKKSDFGYMSLKESAAIAAALTKDIDFFEGTDGSMKSIEDAVQRIKDTTQKFTKAIGPLKDVFGSDIPEMIKAIEGLTNKSFASLDPTRLGNLISRASAGIQAGIFDKDALLAASRTISMDLQKMNVAPILDLSAGAQSMDVLSRINGALRPIGMSEARYRNWVGETTLRSSASTGAEAFNQAYAVWKMRAGNEGKTINDFNEAYNALRANKRSADQAFLELSDTRSFAELKWKAYGSDALEEAYRNNYGGVMALQENAGRAIATGRDLSNTKDAYDEAVKLYRANPKIGQNTAELDKAIEGLTNLSPEKKQQVRAEVMRISMGYYDYGDMKVGAAIAAEYTAKKNQADLDRRIKYMDEMNGLKTNLAENGSELIRNIIANPSNLFDTVFVNTPWLASIKNKDVRDDIYEDLAYTVKVIQGKGIDINSDKAKEMLNDTIHYTINNAPLNSYRMDLVEKRKELNAQLLKTNFNSKEYSRIEGEIAKNDRMLYLARFVDSSVLEQMGYEKAVDLDLDLGKRGVSEEDYRGEFRDNLILSKFREKIESSNLDKYSKERVIKKMEEISERKTKEGKQTTIQDSDITEVTDFAAKKSSAFAPGDKEEVTRIFNDIMYENKDTDQLLTDNLRIQRELLVKLEKYFAEDAKDTTRNGQEAEPAGFFEGIWNFFSSWHFPSI